MGRTRDLTPKLQLLGAAMSETQLLETLSAVGLRDVVDVALLAAIIYWLLNLIKGTRTIPILLGLTVMLVAYTLSGYLQLDALGFVMENLISSVVVIVVVLFQTDIRNALARLGLTTMFREQGAADQANLIDEVVQAAFALARRRIGGTLVLERETGLRNFIERGRPLEAVPSVDLLLSIFHTSSPLHDGAVIITRAGRLAAARCILPLSPNLRGSAALGTRHRSALGLSEETDAVIVVVSEERGQVSLAFEGALMRDLDEATLRRDMTRLLQREFLNDAIEQGAADAQSAQR